MGEPVISYLSIITLAIECGSETHIVRCGTSPSRQADLTMFLLWHINDTGPQPNGIKAFLNLSP